MLDCLNTSGNLAGSCTDMTVLERQRGRIKWQQDHLQHQHHQVYNSQGHGSMMIAEMVAQAHSNSIKPDAGLVFGPPAPASGFDVNFANSRTCSCSLALAEAKDTDSGKMNGKDCSKKRKADKPHNTKVVDKRIKVGADYGESKITEQTSTKNNTTTTNNNNRETCADTSKENSKVSEVQKPDYIHVRARRGQATDSHSLAERVRREKISERMKYLQDLVPGCNKITGKAGMLDEIINYVQSLQRQVEFLSMKLAAVNPTLDFNIDDLFAKEVFPACAASFPTTGMSSDMANPAYLQFSSPQQIVSGCGLDTGINPPDMGLRRTISAPVSMPETFLDSSCFTQILPSSTWEGDFQNLYNVAFDQARATSFPTQLFTGLVEASNLKMEM